MNICRYAAVARGEKLPHSQVKQNREDLLDCIGKLPSATGSLLPTSKATGTFPILPSTLYFTVTPGVTKEGSWCDCSASLRPALRTQLVVTVSLSSSLPSSLWKAPQLGLSTAVFHWNSTLACMWFYASVHPFLWSLRFFDYLSGLSQPGLVLLKCQGAFWCFVLFFPRSILIFTSWILQLPNGFRKNFHHIYAISKGSVNFMVFQRPRLSSPV